MAERGKNKKQQNTKKQETKRRKFESIYDKAYTLVVLGDRSSSAVNGVTSICNNKVNS